jgi:hypothetical protein
VSLIVGTIAGEGGEWLCDLVEQRLDLRTIIDIAAGQLRGEDLPGFRVDRPWRVNRYGVSRPSDGEV